MVEPAPPAYPAYPVEAISKLLNLTPRRIQQLVREGVIPRPERGKYDLIRTIRGYVKYLQERAEGRGVEPTDLHGERTRLLKAQADKTELEIDERMGALLPAERIIAVWEQLVAAFRAKCLALPSKLAPLLRGKDAVQDIKEIIAAGVREALEELSRFELADNLQESSEAGGASRDATVAVDGGRMG
ncbi:MAG: hypothetical protein ACHBMF_03785 [Chromatiales bacterium]